MANLERHYHLLERGRLSWQRVGSLRYSYRAPLADDRHYSHYAASSTGISAKLDVEQELQAKWQRAIETRQFPDTILAHGIFTNIQKYPDDIILTRVGMFYEVSRDILL